MAEELLINVNPFETRVALVSHGLLQEIHIARATGYSVTGCLSATAMAHSAAVADALATTLAISPPAEARSLLRAFRGQRAVLVLPDGRITEITA